MKNAKNITAVTLLVIVLYSLVPAPIRMVITQIYEVPQCTAQFARTFGTRSDFSDVKKHVMDSIQIGMSSGEVLKTLSQFGTVSVINPIFLEENKTIKQFVVEIFLSTYSLQAMEFYCQSTTQIPNKYASECCK